MSVRYLTLTAVAAGAGLMGLVLLPAPDARATSCATYSAPVVVKKVVAAPVYAAAVVPVAVYQPVTLAVPLYGAAYVPAPVAPAVPAAAPQPAPGPSADTKAILDALRALDGRLRSLEGRGAAPVPPAANPVPPPPGPPPGAAAAPAGGTPRVFTAKCIQCHQRGKLDEGTTFVLLEPDGSVAPLNVRSQLMTSRKLYNFSMPPKDNKFKIPPCTDQEVAEAMAYLDTLK